MTMCEIKSPALLNLYSKIKEYTSEEDPFLLKNYSSGDYNSCSYLIPHIADLILANDIGSLYELWHFISTAPDSIVDFILTAQHNFALSDNATIYAAYIIMFRMANIRTPNVAQIHFKKVIKQDDALTLLLKASYINSYGIEPEEIETDILIRTALDLEYGKRRYTHDMEPIGVKIFPAFELKKAFERNTSINETEEWKLRWRKHGGLLYKGRMIALKNNSIWEKLSIFSKPYPPYSFGSGMVLSSVSKEDCIKLGLMKYSISERIRKRILKTNFEAKGTRYR